MRLRKTLVGVTVLALMGINVSMFSNLDASADAIGQAWLMMYDGGGDNVTGVSNWNASDAAGAIDIVGNGSYTISFDIPEGCGAEQINFLGISTDINMYYQDDNEVEIYKDMTFDISSIVIDGVEIDYTKSDNADGTNDDGVTYRLSIYDVWSSRGVQDIDNVVSCAENITINFDVSGIATDDVSYSGSCGKDCTYSFDETTGTLTISGTGDMMMGSPWYQFEEDIKTVIIEDGITSIGYYAFSNCTSLTEVTLSDSITQILPCAFQGCTSLEEITIPDSVTEIDNYAFGSCTSLTKVVIPDSVIFICGFVFENCTSLTEVTIPGSVTSIGERAFGYYDDGKIEDFIIRGYEGSAAETYASENDFTFVSLGDVTTTYNYNGSCGEDCTYSFDTTTGTLTISGTGDMNDYSFYNIPWYSYRDNIKSVTIEDGVTSIGDNAFGICESLTEITIPNSVTSIGDYAFWYCASLKEITIPDSVTSIGRYAFQDCTSLEGITIPNSATYINEFAFYRCTSLKEIIIPNSITAIWSCAFYNCTSLTDVYYNGTEEEWSSIVIHSSNEPLTNATIHYKNVTPITNILKIKKYMLGISVDSTELDINSDGDVNILDLITMLNDLNR